MDKTHKTKQEELSGINSIKLVVYFFTNEGKVQLPDKQAFPKGKVTLATNHKKKIRVDINKDVFFGGGNQPNLYEAIKKCLKNYEVDIIPKEKISEYKRYIKVAEEISNKEVNF